MSRVLNLLRASVRLLPAIALGLLVVLALIVLDTTNAGIDRLPIKASRWPPHIGREELPGRVDLTLVVSNRTLSASYRLTLPPAQPLFKATQQGDASAGALARLLGRIEADGRALVFEDPVVNVPEGSADGEVTLRSQPLRLDHQRSRVTVWPHDPSCCLPPTRVLVRTARARVIPIGQLPMSQSSDQTVYAPVIFLDLDLLTSPPASPGSPRSRAVSSDEALDTPLDGPSTLAPLVAWQRRLPGSSRLTVSVSRQVLTTEYRLRLPRSEPLFRAIQDGAAADPRGLVGLLGRVTVDDRAVTFTTPSLHVERQHPDGEVVLRSRPVRLATPRPQVAIAPSSQADCCFADSEVVVQTEGAGVLASGDVDPVEQSAATTVFKPVPSNGLSFDLVLETFSAKLVRPPRVNSLLQSLNDFRIPAVSWLLYWVTASIPLLALVNWYRGRRLGGAPGSNERVQAVEILLFLYLLVLIAVALADLSRSWSPASFLIRQLQAAHWWRRELPHADFGGSALILVAACVLWPALAHRRMIEADRADPAASASVPSSGPSGRRLRLRGVCAGLATISVDVLLAVAVAAVLLGAALRSALPRPDVVRLTGLGELAAWLTGAGIVLFILLHLLARPLGVVIPRRLALVAIASLVALTVSTDWHAFRSWQNSSRLLW
jgi:hypothetical protein